MDEVAYWLPPRPPDVIAFDGSDVRFLVTSARCSAAHFRLGAGEVSRAACHRSVEEIWFVVAGEGEMWRGSAGRGDVVAMRPGVCLTIPAGTSFQFRTTGPDAVEAVAVTIPPWPGDDEVFAVDGAWPGAAAL